MDVRYERRDGRTLGFQIGPHDTSRALVIDPVIVYSSYLGGSLVDNVNAIAVDGSGAIYVTGQTFSNNFPRVSAFDSSFAGESEAFVTKFNASGSSLVYSTYLGGNKDDNGFGIAVDASGNAYVAGSTDSIDFPLVSASQTSFGGGAEDAFVAKLSATGLPVYSTYLGGSGADNARGIDIDESGNAYVAGQTSSPNFPTSAGVFQTVLRGAADAFVTKLDSTSGRVYSTYLGGSGVEIGNGIAVHAGRASLAGTTNSTDLNPNPTLGFLPTYRGGASDGFVANLNPVANSMGMSYLGGSGTDVANDIAVTAIGAPYITGVTESTNFPTVSAFHSTLRGPSDAFLTSLTDTLGGASFSTYYGGDGREEGLGVSLSSSGDRIYFAGNTNSTDFPLLAPVDGVLSGGLDAFVVAVSATPPPITRSVSYATYLGGSQEDAAFAVAASRSGPSGVYIAGDTVSTDFPVVAPFRSSNAGTIDVFVTKLVDVSMLVPALAGREAVLAAFLTLLGALVLRRARSQRA